MGGNHKRIDTLQKIADYYGISLSSLRAKHLADMRECNAILYRTVGRPPRVLWFSYENLLQRYAVECNAIGKSL